MIKIKRTSCPSHLRKSKAKKAYRDKKIVQRLWKMQNEKCCYCEMKIPVTGHAKAVEHFQPQSIFKYRVNDWKNLLLACSQCNGKKSDKFPVKLTDDLNNMKVIYIDEPSPSDPLLIDPSDNNDDPENHLTFIVDDVDDFFGLIVAKDGKNRGRETINVIGLDCEYYTREHREHLLELMELYDNLLRAKYQNENGRLGNYKEKFIMKLSAKCKLTAVTRVFAKKKKLYERFEINIPNGYNTI